MKINSDKYYDFISKDLIDAVDALKARKSKSNYKKLSKMWFKIFHCSLKKFMPNLTKKDSYTMFLGLAFENGHMFHIEENNYYKDYSFEQLINEFKGDISYWVDRASFDRIFRTHWLYTKIAQSINLCLYSGHKSVCTKSFNYVKPV